MISITFQQEDGSARTIQCAVDRSLMEAARDNDIANIVAECGGSLACGTCHVVISSDWLHQLPGPNSMELEMIGGLENPRPTSRLSCQIALDERLDGLTLLVPHFSSL